MHGARAGVADLSIADCGLEAAPKVIDLNRHRICNPKSAAPQSPHLCAVRRSCASWTTARGMAMRRRMCTYPPFPRRNTQKNHATKNFAETIQVYKPTLLIRALLRRGLDRTLR